MINVDRDFALGGGVVGAHSLYQFKANLVDDIGNILWRDRLPFDQRVTSSRVSPKVRATASSTAGITNLAIYNLFARRTHPRG